MKYAEFSEEIKNEDILQMLFEGEVICNCPYCEKKLKFSVESEIVKCPKCLEDFQSPLSNERNLK
jgi:ribosomal protein L37AE/L43A